MDRMKERWKECGLCGGMVFLRPSCLIARTDKRQQRRYEKKDLIESDGSEY